MDSLMFGVVLAWIWTFHRERIAGHVVNRRGWCLAAGCLLLLPTLFFPLEKTRWMHVWGFSVFAVAGLCLVLWALGRPLPSARPVPRALAWIGFYSYSIYLWHMPVGRFFSATAGNYLSKDLWPFCFLALSIVMGVFLGKLIEWPMLHLRDRWFPRRKRMAARP
jgi:peptidoglycan/LPS O-acetylase OafA/YrhL